MAGVSPRQAHIALQERRRFVQHTVRTPAIRTRKYRRRAMGLTNTFVLRMDQRQRIIPAHPNELILPARTLRIIRRGQKTLTHHRPAHAGFAVHLIAHHSL
ncbi:hypothetical protein D3C81_1812210 [compost metagenome]